MPGRTVPTIDFAGAHDDVIAAQIDAAMRELGGFHALGLGLDPDVAAGQLAAARRLAALSDADREALAARDRVRRFIRYPDDDGVVGPLSHASMTTMFAPDEAALQGTVTAGPNRWPAGDPALRDAVEAFHRAMLPIGHEVARLVARALAADSLVDHFRAPTCYVRLHLYPARRDRQVGCGEHTDHGFLSFLLEDDVGGFELAAPDGTWIDAPPVAGALLVLGGEVLARLTNRRWRAPLHRARHTADRLRCSSPFFFDPTWDATIACLPGCCGPDDPPREPPARYCDLVLARWNRSYV